MIQKLYLLLSHDIDADFASHTLIGAYRLLESAVTQMQKAIYNEFDEIKEWWEDDEEESVEEQYQEWIEENYLDDEQTSWSYTDDEPVEHTYKIQTVEVDDNGGDMYALICTRVDGVENRTDVLGVYNSQQTANEDLEAFESNDDNDSYLEVVTSIKKFSIE